MKKRKKKVKIGRTHKLIKKAKRFCKNHPIETWDDLRLLTLYYLIDNEKVFNRYVRMKKQPLNLKIRRRNERI